MDVEGTMRMMDNPLSRRVMLLLAHNGPNTPKGIMELLHGVPQASLYRTIHTLEDGGYISVVSEERKRAVVERTYGISDGFKAYLGDMILGNDMASYRAFTTWTLQRLAAEFDEYCGREGADIVADGSCIHSTEIYATREELNRIHEKIMEAIKDNLVRTSPDQGAHNFSVVVSPPREVTGDD